MAKVYDNATDLITFARLQSQNTTSGSSYLGSDGLLKFAAEDEPRIEYGSDGSLKGLLIEEQRTNLLTHSEDFSGWLTLSSASLGTIVTAPTGDEAAVTLDLPSANSVLYKFVTVAANVPHTFSVWLKGDVAGTIRLARSNSGPDGADVPVSTEWTRQTVTITPTTTSDGPQIRRNTVGQLDKVYIYGAQLEEGSFATSYIPTSGSQQTRSADVASIPVTAFGYNQDAGTVVVEALSPVGDNDNRLAILVDAGTADNRVVDLYRQSTAIRMYNGYTALSLVYPNNPAEGLTAAGAYSAGDYAHIVDGGSPSTANSASVNDPDTLFIGCNGVSQRQLNGHIKSIQYFPRRLTNTQLQELTA